MHKNIHTKKEHKPKSIQVGANTDDTDLSITAQPKDISHMDEGTFVDEITSTGFEDEEMNLADAKESGYTDAKGHAISMAKKDVPASPTGAYTDIGAGRSSVVHRNDESKGKH